MHARKKSLAVDEPHYILDPADRVLTTKTLTPLAAPE
jgi:hypothetical protein